MAKLLESVILCERIYELDLSNENSQAMNRFGESIELLFEFGKNNQTTSILKLDNLSIKKQGV